MCKNRQSKFERRTSGLPFVLQQRDVEIIDVVYFYRLLRRDQIQRLMNWPCTTRMNVRLRKLYDNGYLNRSFLPTTKGSSQAIYSAGENSIHILLCKASSSIDKLRKKIRYSAKISPLFLNHALMSSEARLRLTEALTEGGAKPNLWVTDFDCVDHFSYRTQQGKIIKRHLKPDGYFRYVCQGRIYSCFLEVDTGSMGHRRILEKAKVYLEYRDSGLYAQRFRLKNFRILFVVQSKERALALKTAFEAGEFKNIWLIPLLEISPSAAVEQTWFKTFETERLAFLAGRNVEGKP